MRSLLFLASVALIATLAQAADVAPATPLPNPGFEASGEMWSTADDTSQIIADAAHEGKMGLRVGTSQYSPTGSSVTSARFPVVPGQEITLSFFARARSECGGAYLLFYKADGKWGKNFLGAVKNTDGQWHQYEVKVKAPDDAAMVTIWVHSYSSTRGTIDFDDFALGGLAPDARPQAPPAPRKASPAAVVPTNLAPRKQPPVIIIKLDDLKQVKGKVHPAWQKVADYLESRKIKASMGVICQTLEEATPEYAKWLRERQESGRIEFWFHGWDHAVHEESGEKYNEFSHRSYEDQRKRFDDSQRLAREKLGFTFATFGPGGGVGSASFDETTLRVMADEPGMRIFLYPKPLDEAGQKLAAAGKVTILDRVWDVNIEGAVGVPDVKRLMQGYAKHPDREYFVLQGHPAMWAGERFDEFGRIVDFLIEQKAVFMTPGEYVASKARPR